MENGVPYKKAELGEQWDAIIIGSGIGGLTAALTTAEGGDQQSHRDER